MRFDRSSGILLHVTSLPSPGGIGDLGPVARQFIEFLQRTNQCLWQMLPIGPVGYGNSPYQSPSSFAGNPLLVSLEELSAQGLLTAADLASIPTTLRFRVEYETVGPARLRLLHLAHQRFCETANQEDREQFQQFRQEEEWWLDDFALFSAIKRAHDEEAWMKWEPELVRREPAALREWSARLADQIEFESWVQFQFERQWRDLKQFAHERRVRLIGDVPIFVAHDSADVWANQHLFLLDSLGQPTVVAGVPPDYFSASGQLWGNPLYRWDEHANNNFEWWISRLQHAFERFDILRIDHFRGFESHWEVPGNATDARGGRWVPGSGRALFRAAESALGSLPVIAEDLGVITPAVEALRDEFRFPGLRVLQFAFGDDPKASDYQPHNYPRNCIVYTGTHDNDTTVGWFNSQAGVGTTRSDEQVLREREFTLNYVGTDGREIHWDLIRLALSSVADVAIVPLQDVLGLDTASRMNRPGTASGNWDWKFIPEWLTPQLEERLALLTEIYDRDPDSAARRAHE
jgi:4-alpha-glucanotransferase